MPKNNPLISVIIPAYNAEKFITETINSVLAQTYNNIEIIVVDDGSTDSTIEKVKLFGDKVNIFSQPNSGVSKARNFAVEKSKGELLAFVDADDLWLPTKIEKQFSSISKQRWSHCDSFYIGFNQDGKTRRSDLTKQYGGQVFDKLLINNFITTSTILIQKDLFLTHGGFDESLPVLEDWKLWMDIAQKEDIHYLEEPLTQYRVYPGSTSRKAREVLPAHINIINHAFKSSSSNKKMKKQALSASYEICSYIAEDADDHSYALLCALKSYMYQPVSLKNLKRIARTIINQLTK